MTTAVYLRNCTLAEEFRPQFPIGIHHADDGIATPDGFQWGHKITHWFAVDLVPDIGAMQIMSWSRLAKALKHLGQTEPYKRDGYGDDDINYSGPPEPPLELPYELSWTDKRAAYPPNSSFKGIPKLEHRIRLPEMLHVVNKPVMRYNRCKWSDYNTKPKVYYRVYPPPRHLFEEERFKATIHFSSDKNEFIGNGHWSNVFRVRMEHPDFTCQLKKKRGKEEKEGGKMDVDDSNNVTTNQEQTLHPIKRYSPQFFRALLHYYITQVRKSTEGGVFPMNLDPELSDEVYERRLRESGEYGVPWWAVCEAYLGISKLVGINTDGDVKEKEKVPQPSVITFDQTQRRLMQLEEPVDLFFGTSENEPDTPSERLHRSQQVIFRSVVNTEWNDVIERMLGEGAKTPSSDNDDEESSPILSKTNVTMSSSGDSKITTSSGISSTTTFISSTSRATASSIPTSNSSCTAADIDEWETHFLPFSLLAKLPLNDCDRSEEMILREGWNYSIMPNYLSEAREGYIQTKPLQQPQPCCAAIPKFYGLYVSEPAKGQGGDVDDDKEYIMLMEECGRSVRGWDLKTEDKNQILSLSVRLHRFGMLQGSPKCDNVVVQPGPLTLPPSSRSFTRPSFRIIDFGRGRWKPKEKWTDDWCVGLDHEEINLADDLGWYGYSPAGRIWPGKGPSE